MAGNDRIARRGVAVQRLREQEPALSINHRRDIGSPVCKDKRPKTPADASAGRAKAQPRGLQVRPVDAIGRAGPGPPRQRADHSDNLDQRLHRRIAGAAVTREDLHLHVIVPDAAGVTRLEAGPVRNGMLK